MSNKKFIARFGEVIMRDGIASIPNAIFAFQKELGLNVGECWFVAQILRFKWSTELPRPSLRKMAEYTGVSARTLHNYKNSLIDKGFLEIVNRRDATGRKDTNYYDFTELFNKIVELIDKKEDYSENPLEEPEVLEGPEEDLKEPLKSDEFTKSIELEEPEEPIDELEQQKTEELMNNYTEEKNVINQENGVCEKIAHRGYGQNFHIGMGKNNTYLCEKITPHKKKNIKKKNIKKNNNPPEGGKDSQPSSEVVVKISNIFKETTGLDKLSLFNMLVKKYGLERVEKVVIYLKDMMPRGKIQNPIGFVMKALEEDWTLDEYDYQKFLNKQREERIKKQKEELEREKNQRASPEVAKKYLEEMKKTLLEVGK